MGLKACPSVRLLVVFEEHGVGGVQTMLQALTHSLSDCCGSILMGCIRGPSADWRQVFRQATQANVILASNAYRPAYLAAFLGWVLRKPVIVWVHGPVREVMAMARTGWMRRQLMGWAYGRARTLVFVSDSSRESLRTAFPGVGDQRCVVIRNPAPAADGHAAAVQMPVAQLGFVGRLSPEKRPEWLLQMLLRLPEHYRLTVIGDGPLRAPLEAMARAQGLMLDDPDRDRVRFLGEMTVTPAVYRTWNATVICSAYEGYPMVALESLAAGVACIGVPIPALREMLSGPTSNWLADDEQPESLAHTVVKVLSQPPQDLRRLATTVAERHAQAGFRAQWAQVLDRVLSAGSSIEQKVRSVHCVHTGHAYMPELHAYAAHVQSLGYEWVLHRCAATVPVDADVVWWMCGVVSRLHSLRLRASLHVHEYSSASVGSFPGLKDHFKRWWNPVPHYRVFQSEPVRELMGFSKRVPYCLRDMGVPESFSPSKRPACPPFDLVYAGATSRLLAFQGALDAIGRSGLRVLLVGSVSDRLAELLKRMPWIHAIGSVAHSEIPGYLVQARAGLNLVPAHRPYTVQTSTKVLEYLAVGLPVVSNRYPWMETLSATPACSRIHWIDDVSSPTAWAAAVSELDGPQEDGRLGLVRTWPQILQELPIWADLERDLQRSRR